MSRRKQAKPIRHLDDEESTPINGKTESLTTQGWHTFRKFLAFFYMWIKLDYTCVIRKVWNETIFQCCDTAD